MTCYVVILYTLNLENYMPMNYFIRHLYHFIKLTYLSLVFLSSVRLVEGLGKL